MARLLANFYCFLFVVVSVVSAAAVENSDNNKERVEHGAPSGKIADHLAGKAAHSDKFDHEAILGSDKAVDEYGNLHPEEAKKRLRILAKEKMDKNGDGFVTEQELEETEERFDEIDSDKDGMITWAEYIQEAFGVEAGKEVERFMSDPEDMKLMNEDRKYFGAADSDHDMVLNKQEFAAFQNPEHHEQMHSTLIENTLLEKDANKDGVIDLKEYLGDTYEQPTSEWFITEKEWLVPDIRHTARQEAQHLIKTADDDRDGELSIQEIVDAHKTFVGSEATSYGEKLMDVVHEEL
uniref:Reticulocalbin-3 n=1 Tax=Ditylenchus dipsaci TaxID=166011 RepID=A0A915EJ27_9BILA